ncbi:hypothetical protein C8J48_0006 [Desmospora activa DSM 45169]|uniref:Uncharacterized protein n=1 Tax=Desmospora activa DSM 45169 TaxID=1121389 RepID=A0A2T4Z6D5_9BACL|nr:hypothetical protein C8J48_0006 [Desmospora activa DSM 45169]
MFNLEQICLKPIRNRQAGGFFIVKTNADEIGS